MKRFFTNAMNNIEKAVMAALKYSLVLSNKIERIIEPNVRSRYHQVLYKGFQLAQ